MKTTSEIKTTSTRTELPFCEAIYVRKENIGSIVRAVTKLKAGTNLKVHTEFKAGIKHKVGTIIKVYTDFKAGTNFKSGTIFKVSTNLKIVFTWELVPTSICIPTPKLVPTSKMIPLLWLKLLIDGATSNIFHQKICDNKINMVLHSRHEYVLILYQP